MKARFFFVFKWLCVIAATCLAYGFLVEPKLFKVRYVSIVSPHYSGDPLRIGLISDIHIGSPHVSAARTLKIVEDMNAEQPDIVLITGDYIGGHLKQEERRPDFNAEIERGIAALGKLQAPLGVYSSLGNHDAWYSKSTIWNLLEQAGVTVLDNDSYIIPERLCIVGLADFDTGQVDTDSFNDCPSSSPHVVITHSPDSFQFVRSDTALAVAGHTHGGQINIPLIGRRVTSTQAGKKYAYGHVNVNSTPAFVTAGVGTSILPARFRSPPEFVILTLSAPDI